MKKIYSLLRLLLLLLIFPNVSKASHVSGGDITYICVGPNQYEITFTMYRDCSGITVPTTIPVTFTNTCGLMNPATVNLTLRNPVTNAICAGSPTPCATEVSQLCPSQIANSTCNGGGLPGMQEYIYRGVVTFPGPCNSWTIAHEGNARNNSMNVTSSSSQDYYFEAVLRTTTAACNNSPVFTAQPIPYLCVNEPVSYNLATIETDGDSLFFSLIPAKNGPGSNVPYNAGYSGASPIPGITINPSTGQLSFTPVTLGNFIVVVQVEEFNAAGQSLGTVYRDFQFVIQNCTNTPPDPSSGTITGLTGTALQTGPYSLQMCEGDNFTFDAEYIDPNAPDSLSMVTNITSTLTGSTYTITAGGNPLEATFSWTAPAGSGGSTLSFVVTIEDDACPIPGINTYTYTINVVQATTAGPDRYYCPAGGPIQLNASGGTSFSWSPGTGLSCTSCSNPMASPAATTTYTVTSNLASGCVNTATITVNVVPDFVLSVTNDTTICRNNAAFLYANGTPSTYAPYTYSWTPSYALSSTNTATTYASPQMTTTYYVTATSNAGCQIHDSVKVTINGEAAVIYASSDQTLVCPGTQVQLTTNFIQPCGIVDYGCTGPAGTVQLGAGSWSSSSIGPFYGNSTLGQTKHQYIYTAAEISAALGSSVGGGKNITQLSFKVASVPSIVPAPLPAIPPNAEINVRIGCSTQGEFTSYTSPFITGLIPVKTNYSFTPVVGWNTIVFDDTYRWDGESDIVVEVCTNIGFAAATPVFYSDTWPKYYTLYKNTTSASDTAAKGCAAIMGTRAASRADIRFTMCDAVPTAGYTYSWTPSAGVTNPSIPNPLATVNYTTNYQIVVADLSNPQCQGIGNLTVYADSTNDVIAGPDTVVCPGTTVQLNAIVTGPPPSSSIPCGVNGTTCTSPQYLSTIGTGTTYNTSTSYPAPYGNWFWGAKHQILYTAADLTAAGMESGTISELAFNVAALNSGTLNYNNIEIKMKCTSVSSLTTWQTGLSTVYTAANYTVALGWNTHVFTNSFDWDGVSNIIVEFCFNNSSYIQNISTYWTPTPYPSVVRYIADNSTVCSAPGGPTSSNNRPNIRFKSCNAPPVFLSYSWAPAGSVSDPTIPNPTALINTASSFTVTVTGTHCTVMDTVDIAIGTVTPVITASGPLNICPGDSVILTSSLSAGNLWSTGQTTQSITVTSAGSYTVSSSCGTTSAATVVTMNPVPDAIMSGGGTICPGASTPVTIDLTGTGPWTITYSNGTASTTVPGISASPYVLNTGTAGNYSLVSVNDALCSGTVSGSANVIVNPPITISNLVVACNGIGTNYGVSFEISGGDPATYSVTGGTGSISATAPYIYSDSVSTSTPAYSYTITDVYNCAPQVVSGTQNCGCPATATISGGGTVCAGTNATVNISLTGSSPWDVTYSNGSTNTTVTGITTSPYVISTGTAGTYSIVSISDASCVGSGSGSATVIITPLPTVTVSPTEVCEGSSGTLTASPSPAGGAFAWSTGASGISMTDTPVATTTYTVTYTASGCSNTGTGTITVKPVPTVSVIPVTICNGETANLVSNTSIAGGTFVWAPGGATTADINVTPVTNTTYTVTYTLNGCSSTGTGMVTVTPNPVVTVNSPFICEGDAATLTAGGAASYSWSTSGSASTETVSPASTTSYTVTGTTSGCTGTAVSTVTVNPIPTVTVTGSTICAGTTGNLTATPSSGGGMFVWSPGGATTATISVSPSATTTYTVTYTMGSCSSTGSGTVTVNPLPVVTLPADMSVCVNSTVPATSFSSSPSGATYTWVNSNTLIGIAGSGTGDVPSFSANNASSSPITATIIVTPTLGGCTGPAEAYTITVNPDPTAFVSGGGTLCNGASATINVSFTGVAPWNMTYTDGATNTAVSGIATPTYSFTTPVSGTYSVIAVSDANCNGTASGSATVSNYAPISVSISGLTSVCPGSPTTLTASASGGSGPYGYSWSPAGGGSSITVSPSVSTTYTVTASDGCATPGTASVTVNMLPVPTVAFSSNVTSGCAPLCINLTDASFAPGGSVTAWSWTLGSSGTSTIQNPSAYCFTVPGQYDIGLTVTGSNGCTATLMNNNMITVNALPDADIMAPENVSILEASVNFTNASTNEVSWSWDFGDPASGTANTSSLENPVHAFSAPGVYCVTLTVTSAAGCTDVTQYCVTVEDEFTFYIPNAFSPNGDGLNDVFSGKGQSIEEYQMSIYDRWGSLIYFSNDITKGWNGAMKNTGEICQMDVYVYNIYVKEENGKKHNYIGKITLVK